MIKGIEHTALSVSDLDRSVAFYCDRLGFDLVRILECPSESGLGDVVGLPGCKARIAHVQAGRVMLELFEYQSPQGKPIPENQTQADNGFIHAGLISTDTRADYARLKNVGVRFMGEPKEFRPGVWIVYFFGPDGEVLELRQTPE